MPEVAKEQKWGKVETLRYLVQKSGYYHKVDSKFIDAIKLTRYQSTKDEMSYSEFEKIINQKD